jgi:hypothetical protein
MPFKGQILDHDYGPGVSGLGFGLTFPGAV